MNRSDGKREVLHAVKKQMHCIPQSLRGQVTNIDVVAGPNLGSERDIATVRSADRAERKQQGMRKARFHKVQGGKEGWARLH